MRLPILCLALTATPAFAQEGPSGIAFTFGLGAESAPGYFGSKTSVTGPAVSFSLDRFRWGSIGIGEGPDKDGIGFTGSFRVVGERTSADYPELSGFADIDPAIEVGGGLTYTSPGTESFAVVRRGFGGHEGFVAELGGDLIFYPSEAMTIRAGPRLLAGDDSYADTYFGLNFDENVAILPAPDGSLPFSASGGVLSRGIELSADYALTPDWGITGTLRYDELLNDAAISPITQTTDQVTASIVVTRDFSFGF